MILLVGVDAVCTDWHIPRHDVRVQECEATAFLLTGLSRFIGEWHTALPGSIAAVRRAAAAFVAMAALPSVRPSLAVYCEAVSPEEKVCQQ